MPIGDDLLTFLPLFPEETEAAIRQRFDEWANEGVSVEEADEWVDTREPGFFFTASQLFVRESARIYDLMGTEMVAAAFPLYSWGEYLDSLAEGFTVDRLPATQASGKVTFNGPDGIAIPPGTVVGAAPSVENAAAKEYEVTEGGTIEGGTVELPVISREAGAVTDAAADQVTEILSTIESGEEPVTVINPERIVGGSDPESDEALRERLLAVFDGRGPGNTRDYEIWARSYIGVGRVTVIPVWNGPGTVKVIALTADGGPVSAEVVEGLQEFLDPVAGKGEGEAPVGHTVTVETATQKAITFSAEIQFADGYSLDGEGGTIAMEAPILEAVADYVDKVQPGDNVVVEKAAARAAIFDGVHDLKNPKLNGKAENVALKSDPAEVALLNIEGSALTEF